MTQSQFDFLIIGTSPLAQLLAGLLTSTHGKSVLLQGEAGAGHRLPRSIDLSVAAITRPETWALLAEAVPETSRLVTQIGKRGCIARLDPILFANQPASKKALGHVRHMAAAYGLAAERTPVNFLGQGRDGAVLRDAVMLRRSVLEPALDSWMDQCGVRRLGTEVDLTIAANGQAHGVLEDETLDIGQTILADDSAIMAHLSTATWPGLLQQRRASSILTEPADPIAGPVMHHLDSGVTLHQHAGGGIVAYGPGAIADLAGVLGSLVGGQSPLRQAGQSDYVRLITSDGAPALGRVAGNGPDVLAGFGPIGAFLAPAIARWLCGQASAAENDWFGARLVDRSGEAAHVSDIGEPR
ncbi:MAG: hypothetical protein ACOH2N_12770 [Devosia sp.]